MMQQQFGIDEYAQRLERTCQDCGTTYTIGQYLEHSEHYFPRPWDYRSGCETYCLACWLDAGPEDSDYRDDEAAVSASENRDVFASDQLLIPTDEGHWPYEDVYESLLEGDLLHTFEWFFDSGANLAVMPISRVHVERPVVFPRAIIFYPPGVAQLDPLNLRQRPSGNQTLADALSEASRVTREVFEHHPLVIFPCRFDWDAFCRSSHEMHLEFIRWLSGEVDRCCLDFARYRQCRLEPVDALPGHAGQIESNHMMAGALLYGSGAREGRIVGGAAFTHHLTRGLGLPLAQVEWDQMPETGEVGHIVEHALSLYAALLESNNPTARFMQALALLEFLAYPTEFRKFEEVKKVIARYIARDTGEYQRLLDRFFELTGKKDSDSGQIIGYRTRVVHMGERIERLVPDPGARRQLFLELDGYIRPVIEHMIAHSGMAFEEYLRVRETLRPFEG